MIVKENISKRKYTHNIELLLNKKVIWNGHKPLNHINTGSNQAQTITLNYNGKTKCKLKINSFEKDTLVIRCNLAPSWLGLRGILWNLIIKLFRTEFSLKIKK